MEAVPAATIYWKYSQKVNIPLIPQTNYSQEVSVSVRITTSHRSEVDDFFSGRAKYLDCTVAGKKHGQNATALTENIAVVGIIGFITQIFQ